jgi:hypothetical protein
MRSLARGSAIVAALSLVLLSGCSSQSIKTHPVSGKVEIKDGDAALLVGSGVELKHESDETLRPMGNIDASGNFIVKTIHQGEILEGAPEGKYKARIILADESDEGVPKRKGNPFHPRYLDFEKSGLSFTVPSGEYNVSLAQVSRTVHPVNPGVYAGPLLLSRGRGGEQNENNPVQRGK